MKLVVMVDKLKDLILAETAIMYSHNLCAIIWLIMG